MLDVKYLREHEDEVRLNFFRRGEASVALFEKFLTIDTEWRKVKYRIDAFRSQQNVLNKDIAQAKKSGEDASVFFESVQALVKDAEKATLVLETLEDERISILLQLPNLLHPDVPDGVGEKGNVVVKTWGTPRSFDFEVVNHAALVESLGLADFDQGRRVSGQGFNYLLNDLASLDWALQRYGLDCLREAGFTLLQVPLLMSGSTMRGVVNFGDFSEVIYKIDGEDMFLLPTAEHALVPFLQGKTLVSKELPLKLGAVSPAFRKEIGGHGVDMKGLFRMHQFYKVEQVVACAAEDSSSMFSFMQGLSEKFFESLGIPYRVVAICAGDLGAKFYQQYDIEAWFPRQNAYAEVTSCGNCTDYQSRKLGIRLDRAGALEYVHLLNNTMVATSRAMVAILENYQRKDGKVDVPKVLIPYMNGKKVIG